jgi:cyclopropane-fatty-acyl-phospholipid synthase
MSDATLPAVEDQAEELTIALLEKLFSGNDGRAFDVRLWAGRVLEADTGDDPPFTLVLTHPGSLRRMLIPPGELTLAEAYLRGDFDVEGDIVALMGQAGKFENLGLSDWLSLLR